MYLCMYVCMYEQCSNGNYFSMYVCMYVCMISVAMVITSLCMYVWLVYLNYYYWTPTISSMYVCMYEWICMYLPCTCHNILLLLTIKTSSVCMYVCMYDLCLAHAALPTTIRIIAEKEMKERERLQEGDTHMYR